MFQRSWFIIKDLYIPNEALITNAGVKAMLARHGLQPRKKWGQHFLIDGHVLGKILAAADAGPNDTVLEVGPGLGALTQGLVETAGHVVAVELDKDLAGLLLQRFAPAQVTVVQSDILKLDLAETLASHANTRLKVVANLPYYITTPVIMRLLESGLPFASITVMIQKEVAQRMAASPGTKDYGSLTLAIQYHADVDLVANVPTNAFMPRPEVESAVVRLRLLDVPRVAVNKDKLFAVIHAAFGQRRKTLVNALFAAGLGENKEYIANVLAGCGLRTDIRGEALDISSFAQLAAKL